MNPKVETLILSTAAVGTKEDEHQEEEQADLDRYAEDAEARFHDYFLPAAFGLAAR